MEPHYPLILNSRLEHMKMHVSTCVVMTFLVTQPVVPSSNYPLILNSRLEHMKMHELHRGHESMHAEMVLILFVTLIVSQIGLVKWRQISPQSYHVSTADFKHCLCIRLS